MKRKDITKASSVFKKTEQERIGYFHNDTSLNSVTVAFREGVGWFIDSVWHDKTVKPKVSELIVCTHKKGELVGILQEDQVFISSRPGCILYRFSETMQWAYLNDLLGLMEG